MFTSILESVTQRRQGEELQELAVEAIFEFEEYDAEFSFVEGVEELEAPTLETDEEVILDEDDEEYDGSLIDPELSVDDFKDDPEVMEAVQMCQAALQEMAQQQDVGDVDNSVFESMLIQLESDDEDEDDMFDYEDDEDLFESVSDIDTELDEDYVSDDELDANSPEDFGGAAADGVVDGDLDEIDLILDDEDASYSDSDDDLYNAILDDESNLLEV